MAILTEDVAAGGPNRAFHFASTRRTTGNRELKPLCSFSWKEDDKMEHRWEE